MPPVRRYDVSPYVEFGVFQLSDAVQVGAPIAEGDRLGPDDLLVGTGGGVLFRSAGTDFHPAVRLELWDSEPPAEGGRWDAVQASDFDTPEGALQFRSTMAVPFGDEVPLPGGPGTYLVRAYRRGAEEWLVQIWLREAISPPSGKPRVRPASGRRGRGGSGARASVRR